MTERFSAWLTINRACNLRCGWCYAQMMQYRGQENMTMETAEQVTGLFRGLGVRSVIIIGGEPTIHPHFFSIVELIRKQGMSPLLVTNSVRFADVRFLKRTVDAGIRSITTSLKGASNEQYQRLTGRPVFQQVLSAIRHIEVLRAAKVLTHKVSVTVCPDIIGHFDELLHAIQECGTRELRNLVQHPRRL